MPGTVTVRPIQAKLETTNGNGPTIQRLDPYCVAIVGNHHVEGRVCKKGGLTPHWEDSISLSRDREPYCYLEVKDKSLLKDKMLGVCAIDLEMLPGQETQQKWYDLYYQQRPVGEILVETVYTPEVSQGERSAEKMFIKEDYVASDSLRGSSVGMMTTTPTNRNFGSLLFDEAGSDFKSRRSYEQGGVNYSYESGSMVEKTPESILPLRTNMSNLQSELRDMSKRVDEMLNKAKGMDYGVGGRDYSSGSIVIQSTQLVPGMLENATPEEGVHRMPNFSGISGVNASHNEFIEERESHHSSKREKLVDKAKELKQKIVTGMDHIKELAHEKKEELLHRRDDEVEYRGESRSPERKRGGGGMKVKFFEGVEKFAHNSVRKLEEIEEKARGKKEAERREWDETRHDPSKLELMKEKIVEEIVEKLGGHRRHHMVDESVQTEISFGSEENVTMRSFSKGGKKNKISEKVKEFKEKIEEGVENIKESIEEKKGHGHGKKQHHHQHGHSQSHHSHSHSHGHKKKKNEEGGKLHEGMEKLKAVAEAILSQLHHPQESGSEVEAERSSSYSSSSSSSSSRSVSKKRKEKKKDKKKNQKKTGLVKDVIVEGAKEGMKEKAKERAKEKVEDIKEKVIGESEGADDEKVEYDVEVEQVEAVEHKKKSAVTSGHEIKQKIEEGLEIVKEKLGMNKIHEEKILREEEVIITEEDNEKMIEQYIEHDSPHTLKEKVIHGIEKIEEIFGLVHKEDLLTVEEAGENQAYNVDWFKKKGLIEEQQQAKILVEEAPMIDSSKVFAGDRFCNIEADGVEKVKEFYMIPDDETTEKIIEMGQQEKEKESLLEIIKEKVNEGVEKVKEKLHLSSEEKHEEVNLRSSGNFRSSTNYQLMSSPSVEHRQGRDIYHIPIPTSTHSYGVGGDMYDEMKRRYLAPEMMEPSQTYTGGNVLTESLMAPPEPLFAEALIELTGVHSDLFAMQRNEEILEAEPAEMIVTEEIYEVPLGPQDSQGEMPVMEVQKITIEEVGSGGQELVEAGIASDLIEMAQNQALLEGGQATEMVVTEELYEVQLGPQDSQGEIPVMEVQKVTVEEVVQGNELAEAAASELAEEIASDLVNQALLQGQQNVEIVATEEIYEVPLGPQDSQGEIPVMEVREIVVEEVVPGQAGQEFVVDLDKEEGGVGIVQGPGEEGFVLVEEVEEVVLIEKEGEKGNEMNLLEQLENRGIEKEKEKSSSSSSESDEEKEKEKEKEKEVDLKKEHVEIHEENIENEDPNRFKKIFDRVAK